MSAIWSPQFNTDKTEAGVRVSNIELFFDLVFVFTVTQLTAVLAVHTTWLAFGQVLLMLGITWWMYGGYAWLTNAVAPVNTIRRGLLVSGMAGFLTMALAVPHAFAGSGWAFGLGYFVVNAVHTGLFAVSGGPGAIRSLRTLAPINLASAAMVLGGGFASTGWRYGLWGAALAVQIATPYLIPIGGFGISAAHFVERHGLVIIVALGESVVAVGVGIGALHLDLETIGVAVLGLILAYFIFWAYFGGDEERAEVALGGIEDPAARGRTALYSYGYAHYPILAGIVALAAGVKKATAHAFGHVSLAQAIALGGGVALFLAGDLIFRRILRLGRPGYRLIALAGALASIPLGLVIAAGQLGVLVVVMVVPLSIEGYRLVTARAATSGDS
ncbi:MAG TPA: low temperature requirement protein A [Micromonosporaceae bacterium]